jgi:hypothetical protein
MPKTNCALEKEYLIDQSVIYDAPGAKQTSHGLDFWSIKLDKRLRTDACVPRHNRLQATRKPILKSAYQSIVSGGHRTGGQQQKDVSELRKDAHLSGLAGISRMTFLNSDKTPTCHAHLSGLAGISRRAFPNSPGRYSHRQ